MPHADSQIGWWSSNGTPMARDAAAATQAVEDIFQPLYILKTPQGMALGRSGIGAIGPT